MCALPAAAAARTEIGKNFPDDIFRQLRDEPGLLGQGNKDIRR